MNFKKLKQNWETIALVLILVFALFLRLWQLGTPNMWIDETTSSLAASKILEHGLPVFDSGAIYNRALFFHYLEAFFLIFGANDFTARLVSVLFGLATIVLAFYIGKEYSKKAGLLAALFTCLFFLEVAFSKQARMYQLFQFLFFLAIFLLYKFKTTKKPVFLIISLISLVLLVDTQLEGLILVPAYFLIIWLYSKKYWYSLFIPALLALYSGLDALSTLIINSSLASHYLSEYTNFFSLTITAFIILALIGLVLGFMKNKELTLYLLIPTIALFLGLLFIKLFALRYIYSVFFLIPLFLAIFFSILYEKFGKLILIALVFALIYPSNLFFQHNYNTVLSPSINFYDYTAPSLDYKSINKSTLNLLQDSELLVFFSPGASWYIKKPDYVFPFSDSGLGNYALYNNKDYYTGANITQTKPQGKFMILEDSFSQQKLNSSEAQAYSLIKQNCSLIEQTQSLKVYSC
jgi:4-amino-4-deoxy-L-arabinose transferase-like glycosyltransferase